MSKRLRLAALTSVLVALLLGFVGFVGVGSAEAAIPDSDISQDWVHSTAYRVGNGDDLKFYGALQAKNPPAQSIDGCYIVQQLTPASVWTNAGFVDAQTGIGQNPMQHCNYEPAQYQLWRINDGLAVRGIRFVKTSGQGSLIGTHCNTATSCRNMYQGTFALNASLSAFHSGGLSATVIRNDISQQTVHSIAYRVGNSTSTRFYGTLQAKPGPNGEVKCYLMQYQVADGSWLNGEGTPPGSDDGFWLGENVKQDGILQHCSNELAPYRNWIIKVGLKVRGIRFTNGQNTGTHCGPLSATECRALVAP